MRGYSSVVEHLTADQEVSGSIPDAPLPLAGANVQKRFNLNYAVAAPGLSLADT